MVYLRRFKHQFPWIIIRNLFVLVLFGLVIDFSRPSVKQIFCSPEKLNKSLLHREGRWRYHNSVTGRWYPWRIGFENRSKFIEWPVKWWNSIPKSSLGVLVYLATLGELKSLEKSFEQLNELFGKKLRPIVVFHEGDFSDRTVQKGLAKILSSSTPLAFETIQFSNDPSKILGSTHGFPTKYLAMCRFFAVMLPTHPILAAFTFYWRLDTHSFIFSSTPIKDPFEVMIKKKLQYAFVMTNLDSKHYTKGLWSLFHRFLDRHCLKPSETVRNILTTITRAYSLDIIFNNFAITNISLWRENPMIIAWLQTIDLNGGIYSHRWGDAPIQTLTLAQFVPREQIARFRYFGYWHRREYVCASNTTDAQCLKQIQPFVNYTELSATVYRDGCFLPKRRFCHYYQEINSH